MGKTKTAFVGEPVEEKKEHKKPQKKPDKIHIAGLKGGQRIKVVEVDLPAETSVKAGPDEVPSSAKATKGLREPKVRSKKYQEAKAKVEKNKLYKLEEAIKLVKETSYSVFDGAVELHLVVKKTGTSVNVSLPYKAGRQKKIEVASEETIKKLEKGKIDFDVLLATAEMMPKLVPFARVLGPKGLMPNPKNGTLIKSKAEAERFSGNNLQLKTEKEAPLIHTVIGKVSQEDRELIENAEAILGVLGKDKQLVRAYAKATMGPSVKISLSGL